jgi:hypothetical protein
MNTAMARRLALGDRVIWMGKDDCQPSGPGTIKELNVKRCPQSRQVERYAHGCQ